MILPALLEMCCLNWSPPKLSLLGLETAAKPPTEAASSHVSLLEGNPDVTIWESRPHDLRPFAAALVDLKFGGW